MFGGGQQQSVFGGGGAFGQQPQQQAQTGGLFGAPAPGASAFGGQTTQGAGAFGANLGGAATGGLFGQTAQQPQQQMGGGMFGGAGTAQQIYAKESNEFEIQHGFRDSVTAICMLPCVGNREVCAIAGWDGQIEVYAIQVNASMTSQVPSTSYGSTTAEPKNPPPNVLPMSKTQVEGPILGMCWQEVMPYQPQPQGLSSFQQKPQEPVAQGPSMLFIAHSDNNIKMWDPNNQAQPPINIGQHEMPVKDVYSFNLNGSCFLVSAGWDCMVKFWQIQGTQVQQIGQAYVGKPVHQMSGQYPLLVTSHSDKQIHVWNLETIQQGNFNPIHLAESPLRYTTSSIQCFGSGKGYAVGSIEGRVGIVKVNFRDPAAVDKDDFCFKCHRKEEAGKEALIWTVNAIGFNKQHDTFATAGSDGHWVIWNKDTKSRYKQSKDSQMPITAVCFSRDANVFVHAHGEDWTQGAEAAAKRPNIIKIFVRHCEPADVFKSNKTR